MGNSICLLFALIGNFLIIHLVQAQNQDGFISLACGLPQKESPYTDRYTNLTFTSDASYINAGESKRIKKEYEARKSGQYHTLRSFPEGRRNCYNLNITKGRRYLIRATFVYGNYDDQNQSPSFDLYIGPNKWASVDLQDSVNGTYKEMIHVPTSDVLQVCLLKTVRTTPFISTLELRPLKNNTYVPQSGSLVGYFRAYLAKIGQGFIRYPNDTHDRFWERSFSDAWTEISTTLPVDTSRDVYDLPEAVMRSAATPKNTSAPLIVTWIMDRSSTSPEFICLYFAEIQTLKANETREFTITYNSGEIFYGPFSPSNHSAITIRSIRDLTCHDRYCRFELVKTERSTHPPLLNAIEAYTVISLDQSETDPRDVTAIKKIEQVYGLNRISWQGDPCFPKDYLWDGLNCNHSGSNEPPRITSLKLSSSGLTGNITSYINDLSELRELDLSNNNLTGEVPLFLSRMEFLSVINLSNNNLSGTIPQALLQKSGLNLKYEGNRDLCAQESCNHKQKPKKFLVPVVAAVGSLVFVAAALALLFILRRKTSTEDPLPSSVASNADAMFNVDSISNMSSEPSIVTKGRRFAYSEVLKMTNNFARILGKGGFGVVYHGYLNSIEQVAIKMISESSAQGYKQFKAEVELLLRVHHKNLVSLVGYCNEGHNLALVYEYMVNGDLKEHLSGKRGGYTLTWTSRLKIAAEAAQGLEYLHNGCKPPMVHRDVKPTNILLNEHLQAKLGDFGLSRSFPIEGETHVSTVVAGTPGYLDPEYYRTNWLTEKSDVYSFGVVLLEIITNRPIIDKNQERHHITEWIGLMLDKGDIQSIIDPKLQGQFDSNSIWKTVELAMSCVNPSSARRPTMAHVVMELNECLAMENARTGESRGSSLELSRNFGTESTPQAR